MNDNFLKHFGVSNKEFIIYHLLATHGPLTVSAIATKIKIHRPYVYRTLRILEEKKFVAVHGKERHKTYSAVAPRIIKNILEEHIEYAQNNLSKLDEVYTSPQNELHVTSFEGRKGITAMFDDIVISQSKGDIFYRYTSEQDTSYVNTFLSKEYRRIRDKKQLERFVIANKSSATTKEKRLERSMKVIDEKDAQFTQDCVQIIYGNKVSFMNIAKKRGFIIEDASLAQFQKEIFKTLYKRI